MRRAFWGFTVFIVASFLAMALVLFYLAHQGLHGALEDMVRRDLAMTMSVAQGALAQRDYERVEEQVLLWGERDPNIVTFRVVLDDDNLLVAYVRDRQEQHTLQIAQEVLTPAGRTARFEMVYDLTKHRHQTRLLALLFLGFSACGTALFVFSLWMILQRLAIRPLQGEIEERRRAERALRESRERLGLALQGADLGTWDWNVATGAVAFNERWAGMLGYRLDEIEPHVRTWETLVHPDDWGAVERRLTAHLEGSTPLYETEHRLRHKSGGWVWVLDRGKVIERGPDGAPLRVCGTHVDVTARKRAEEERLALERQMQHAQKLESLGVLAGGIAHDFNNILMAVLGNTELALRDLSPHSPARDRLQAIEKASLRAAGLAQQMLAYSGKGRFVIEPIHINEFVKEMVHLLEVSISKKIVLKHDFAEHLPTFAGDANQIRQVTMNLTTNASEAIGDESGVIAISTGVMACDSQYLAAANRANNPGLDEPLPEGPYVYIEVADNGCGMDPATREKLFEPFFTTKFTGRGLGMAAVLGIVRGHRGAIKVTSEVGKGTTFKILFPAADDGAGAVLKAPVDETKGEVPWRGGGTILLADDEEAVCEVGQLVLERAGFKVLTAADGREAVALFREHADEIVCVLLDLTMPHLNGEEAFREMRCIRPEVRVILCSGYNEQEATQYFVGKDLAGFLQKPYRSTALMEKLREVLPS